MRPEHKRAGNPPILQSGLRANRCFNEAGVLSIVVPVHPHACGEHMCTGSFPSTQDGSSPRMWGTLLRDLRRLRPVRFIPTHVGNTPTLTGPGPTRPVHPHACGEHGPLRVVVLPEVGSSPRMWGTRHCLPSYRAIQRFIPTHVGNTGNY